jgi:hypothetical protein
MIFTFSFDKTVTRFYRTKPKLQFFILLYYCPTKIFSFGLKPNTGTVFSNPSLKAGVIKLKPFPCGL